MRKNFEDKSLVSSGSLKGKKIQNFLYSGEREQKKTTAAENFKA